MAAGVLTEVPRSPCRSRSGSSCVVESSSDGGDADVAVFRRRFGALIWRVGVDLRLHTATVATACMYFQRFFLVEAQERFDATRVATACIWLACKVREGDGRRLRDITNAFAAFGSHGAGGVEKAASLPMEEYWLLRDDLVTYEQALLRALAFDVEATTAYSYVTDYAWLLGCERGDAGVAALAWSLLNDAFCSEVCALWAPDRVALAAVLLAVELARGWPELQHEASRVAGRLEGHCRAPAVEAVLKIGDGSETEEICRYLLTAYEAGQNGRQRRGS